MKFAALFAQLHLSPDQIQKFEANVMAKQASVLDLQSALLAQGVSQQDPAVAQLWSKINSDYSRLRPHCLDRRARSPHFPGR
jgi:hypothetical protein